MEKETVNPSGGVQTSGNLGNGYKFFQVNSYSKNEEGAWPVRHIRNENQKKNSQKIKMKFCILSKLEV